MKVMVYSILLTFHWTAHVAALFPSASTKLSPCHYSIFQSRRRIQSPCSSQSKLAAARYGPKEIMPTDMNGDFFADQEEWEKQDENRILQQKLDFKALLEQMLALDNPQHVPGLMTRNLNFLLSMRGYEGSTLMKEALEEAEKEVQNGTQEDDYYQRVSDAMDYIISFMEEFVDQSKILDEQNKQLLGKIVRAITQQKQLQEEEEEQESMTDSSSSSFQDDNNLDIILRKEKDHFTPGFLRHLEGECRRIESAPFISPESSAMLQLLRMIQMRVVEEIGQDLGDGALVLGQLLGYENRGERMAVLDAGLNVRGIDFAYELAGLTQQALEDFQKIPGGVEPGLVSIISELDERIHSYINKTMVGNFQ